MKDIGIKLFEIFARLMSLLPLKVLYVISDFNRLLVYYVFGYRRKTVATNLRNAFPEKSEAELKKIEWQFYRHFCDLFAEVIYMMYASDKKAAKLISIKNPELLEKYYQQGKSIVATGGHYGNWELYSLLTYYIKYKLIGAYKPIQDKGFEKLMNKARSRFGGIPVQMNDIARLSLKWAKEGQLFFLGLINDQTPAKSDIRYWTRFLNQDTAVFLGAEKIARKINQPVLFCNMRKVVRGRYEMEFVVLTESPKETAEYEITEMHVRSLEKLIIEAPQYWLWSHRRWKHRKPTTEK